MIYISQTEDRRGAPQRNHTLAEKPVGKGGRYLYMPPSQISSSDQVSFQSWSKVLSALSNLVSKFPGTEIPHDTQILNAVERKKGGSFSKRS